MGKLIAGFLMWLSGWKLDRNTPAETERCVMVAAPHTSNWDAYYLKLAFVLLGIPMKVAIKNSWTKGFIGLFVRPLGGLGIDRTPKEGSQRLSQTEAMANFFKQHERIALVIAPEGTRRKVKKWKMGFYWVAKEANVPITMGYLDYKNKVAGVGPVVINPTGDMESDLIPLNDFYRDIKGRFPEKFGLDGRFG